MMAGGFAYFGGELAAAVGGTVGRYTASSGHGGVPQYFVQNDGGAPSAVPDAGSGVYGGVGGMDRPTSDAGYGGGNGAPIAMAAPARPLPRARANGALFKAAWTEEEDKALTEAASEYANEHRKWAAISRRLPGRSGKQCRERWINHVDPTIQKKMWTDEEDMELIRAHRSCGNRWSAIAKMLPGRSENSVKNHWNATRRSLRAKRTLKKRNCEQPPPGRPSLLAEYICTLYPSTESPPAVSPLAPAPPTEPDDRNEQVAPPHTAIAAAPLAYAAPAMAGMYYHQNPPNVQHSWAPEMNVAGSRYPYYLPPYQQLNHYQRYGLPSTPAQIIRTQEELQAAAAAPYASIHDYLFADEQSDLRADQAEMDRGSSTNNQRGNDGGGANGWCYYGADGAGPGRSGSGGDDVDVVQMASREFEAQDQYMATLEHLTRFT